MTKLLLIEHRDNGIIGQGTLSHLFLSILNGELLGIYGPLIQGPLFVTVSHHCYCSRRTAPQVNRIFLYRYFCRNNNCY